MTTDTTTYTTTYTTTCWGQAYSVRANWAQASCPVEVRYQSEPWTYDPCGRQVSEFRHSPEDAMRAWIETGAVGDDPETVEEIDCAVGEMVDVDAAL